MMMSTLSHQSVILDVYTMDANIKLLVLINQYIPNDFKWTGSRLVCLKE